MVNAHTSVQDPEGLLIACFSSFPMQVTWKADLQIPSGKVRVLDTQPSPPQGETKTARFLAVFVLSQGE